MQGSIVGDLNCLNGTLRNKAGNSVCRTTEHAVAQSSRCEQRRRDSAAEQPGTQKPPPSCGQGGLRNWSEKAQKVWVTRASGVRYIANPTISEALSSYR